MPASLRKVLFWCHLVMGVVTGLVVIVMSVTGVLLAYQKQLTAWADTRGLDGAPPAAGAMRLPVDSVVRLVQAREAATPTAVTWRRRPDAPVEVAFGREKTVFANAYTGAVLGEGAKGTRTFFRVVTDWHRWLGAKDESRPIGKSIADAANLGFLLIVLSGLFLWLPRRWTRTAVRNVAWFRGGLSGKARDFNWHHVIGIWSFAPLVLVVASGVVISYPWASGLVYRAVGEKPPAPQTPAASPGGGEGRAAQRTVAKAAPPVMIAGLEAMVPRVEERVPGWRAITLQLPKSDTASLAFSIDAGTGGQPQRRATLTLARATGEPVKWEPWDRNTPGRRLRLFLRFAHTGEVFGIPGQTIAALVSLGAVVLAWTGIALTWRRFRSWRGRKERSVEGDEESRQAA